MVFLLISDDEFLVLLTVVLSVFYPKGVIFVFGQCVEKIEIVAAKAPN